MKTKKFLSIILCYFLFYLVSCTQELDKDSIWFKSIILSECQYTTFETDTAVIINNKDELKNYVPCIDQFLDIDFDEFSLILAGGTAIHGVTIIPGKLYKQDNNTIILSLIDNSGSIVPMVITHWTTAIITPKLKNNMDIKLQIRKQ